MWTLLPLRHMSLQAHTLRLKYLLHLSPWSKEYRRSFTFIFLFPTFLGFYTFFFTSPRLHVSSSTPLLLFHFTLHFVKIVGRGQLCPAHIPYLKVRTIEYLVRTSLALWRAYQIYFLRHLYLIILPILVGTY